MGFLGYLINREWNNLAKYWDTTFLYQKNNQIVLARPMEHPLVLYFNSCLKWLSTKELKRIIILSTLTNFARNIQYRQKWNLNLSPYESCWVFSSLYTT